MYLFLLGRDYKLSKLELIVYLKTLEVKYSIISDHDKYLFINFFQKINLNKVITDLGGTTRIAKIFHKSEKIDSNFINYLDLDTPKKFNYSVSSIDIEEKNIESILIILKEYYKSIKSKAVYKKPRKFKKERLTIVNPDNYFSWKLDEGFELFVIKEKNIYYFAKTVFSSSSKENRFKDTNRPLKKNLHTTSFRLARIMVNLLGLEKNKTILDPFCGTGTFLIEGLIRNYNVIGVDKNTEMA
jgi:tRNA G10  N-methylase Trm11